MGKLEHSVKSEIRRTKINKAIIASIATAGLLSISLVAPNVLSILGKGPSNRKYRIQKSLGRLLKRGYAKISDGNVTLTKRGERLAALIGEGRLAPRRQKWDGKWRMLIFDISEKRKAWREKTRIALSNMGFIRLQDSVWIFPYDCEDLITILKIDFRIGRQLLYIIADRIENDNAYRKAFQLK